MMIDTKTAETTPREPASLAPPPPSYPTPQPSPGPQPQGQNVSYSAAAPQPPMMRAMTEAEIGEQYRAAQFAQCAQGNHAWTTKYGVCGIITAVILFPIGLICLFLDKEEICTRCGNKL